MNEKEDVTVEEIKLKEEPTAEEKYQKKLCPICGEKMERGDDLKRYQTLSEHVCHPNKTPSKKPYWTCDCFKGYIGIHRYYYEYDEDGKPVETDNEVMEILEKERKMRWKDE